MIHDVLRSSGQPLDPATQGVMQTHFGHDFSRVRVHADVKGAESAQAINALAYTVGSQVVFAPGQFQPTTARGRQLLGHELVHVVQQDRVTKPASVGPLTLDAPDSALEMEARRFGEAAFAGVPTAKGKPPISTCRGVPGSIARASPDAVGYVMRLGLAARTGIQFFPANVVDTRVGPVTSQGGLSSGGASRLNVIIGENLSVRTLAHQLLPLWNTATPFTPPGAAAPLPLDIITADELARGL